MLQTALLSAGEWDSADQDNLPEEGQEQSLYVFRMGYHFSLSQLQGLFSTIVRSGLINENVPIKKNPQNTFQEVGTYLIWQAY